MNCHESAPEGYSAVMRYPHLISLLVYFLSIGVLLRKHGEQFNAFSKLLLWHTLGSFSFEMFLSFLALPVSDSLYSITRCTGLLMYVDVPGVAIMNVTMILCAHTALTVVELLRFCLDASQIVEKKCDILKGFVYIYRVNLVVLVAFIVATTPFAIGRQYEYRMELFRNNPFTPDVFGCPNTFVYPPKTDIQYESLLILIASAATFTLFVVLIAVILTPIRIGALKRIVSKKTIEMQRMLYLSVLVQVLIHASLLIWPVSVTLQNSFTTVQQSCPLPPTLFFPNSLLTDTPQFIFVMLSYHGTCSTLAMICFTRPVREAVLRSLVCKYSKVGALEGSVTIKN